VKDKKGFRFGDQVAELHWLSTGIAVDKICGGGWYRRFTSEVRLRTFQALVMQALQLRRIYREVFILRDIKGYSTEKLRRFWASARTP